MQMQYLNMKMGYLICASTTTEHMDNTLHMDNAVFHYCPLPSIATVAHTVIWIFAFFAFRQSDQICKWDIYYAHSATWVLLVPNITHIPSFVTVDHIKLWIFAFLVISQSEQICKWDIKYAHLLTTDHMGHICAYHYQHTNTVTHTEPWIFAFFFLFFFFFLCVISQSEQIFKWVA